jgi:serine/threonine-protein kinase
MIPCPSRADLLGLLANQLSAEQDAALLAHVETCPVCQQALEELTASCTAGASVTLAGAGVSSPGEPSAKNTAFWRELKAAFPPRPSTTPPVLCRSRASGATAAEAEAPLPAQLGRYELREEIARGGMGAVLRGHDPDLGRDLAIKVLLPGLRHDPAVVSRFREEAQIGGQLQHPGIVPVHEVSGSDDQPPYFTMKLVRGRTLAALLGERSHPQQDLPRFVHVFEQVCQTLAYAHSRGVIHRDLKPANIMVGAFGEVQVMDWGLAKVLDRDGPTTPAPDWYRAASGELATALDRDSRPLRTVRSAGLGPASRRGLVLGTPAYMAPEQAAGEVELLDERCDVFGLGAILCEILTGQPPYGGGDDVRALDRAMRGDLVEAFGRLDGCGASPELIRLARSSLSPKAADRPRDAAVLAAEMAAYRESMAARLRQAELAETEARTRVKEERKRRHIVLALAGSVLLTLLLVGGGLFLVMRAQQARERQARAALAQARTSLEGARKGNDPALWAEARALARRAEALLEQGPGSTELTEQVRSLLHTMDEEQADRQMVQRLTEANLRGTLLGEDLVDQGLLVRAYEEAFRLYGAPVQHLSLAEAAQRLRARAIRPDLAAALDHWARLESKASERKHLQDLAIAVDDDRRRNQIRQALAKNDVAALKRLCTPGQGASLPATTVALLSTALVNKKALMEAEALLLRAQQEHRGDLWVNQILGGFYLFHCHPPRLDEAIRFYTAAVAVRDDSPAANVWLGLALVDRGRLDEAQKALEKVDRLRPDIPEAHAILGQVLQKKGKLDAAVAAYQTAIRLKGTYAYAYHHLGRAWIDRGRIDRAAAIGLSATSTGPRCTLADCCLALWMAQAPLADDQAIACLTKATRLNKDYAIPHYDLGNIYREQGRYEEAIAAYKEALRVKPDFAEAQNNLGLALRDSGRASQAVMAFHKAIALNPALAQPHYNLGRAFHKQGRLDEAIDAFRKAVTLKMGPLAEVYMNLGFIFVQKGRLYEAVDAFREATRLDKDYARAHSNLGGALYQLGMLDQAIASCREAIRLQPTLPGAHNMLGVVLLRKGSLDEAITSYREAIRLQADYPEAHYNLGLVLSEKGLLAEAIASYRQAIRFDPNYALAHCYLGQALRDQGRFAEALASLRHGHALGSRQTGWSQPSVEWVRQCERLIEVERRLPAILDGKARPVNATEQIEFAWICGARQLHAAAARLYAEAFAAGGEDGEKWKTQYRYSAARHAALAGCSQGKDADTLSDKDRARWRGQAHEWLRAEVVLQAKRLESGKPADRAEVRRKTQWWLADAQLACVRSAEAIARLPAEERPGWTKLWAEVEVLRKKAQDKAKENWAGH